MSTRVHSRFSRLQSLNYAETLPHRGRDMTLCECPTRVSMARAVWPDGLRRSILLPPDESQGTRAGQRAKRSDTTFQSIRGLALSEHLGFFLPAFVCSSFRSLRFVRPRGNRSPDAVRPNWASFRYPRTLPHVPPAMWQGFRMI